MRVGAQKLNAEGCARQIRHGLTVAEHYFVERRRCQQTSIVVFELGEAKAIPRRGSADVLGGDSAVAVIHFRIPEIDEGGAEAFGTSTTKAETEDLEVSIPGAVRLAYRVEYFRRGMGTYSSISAALTRK